MHSRRTAAYRLDTRVFAIALAVTLATGALCAPVAAAISQDEVIARAQRRVNAPVPYSQSAYFGGYRTDCSGYVSMCWKTGTSWSTRSFYRVTHRIPVTDLRRGDAMLKKGYHIRLFYGWLDEARTTYVAYESAYGTIAAARVHSLRDDLDAGYVPVRYDGITASPAPRNVLVNGAFDSWARSWDGDGFDRPLWWEVGPWWGSGHTERRTDTYRSRYFSAAVANPSAEQDARTEIAQTAVIVPKAVYNLSAYIKTPSNPALVELRLSYLDQSGTPVAEHAVTGDRAALSAASFRPVSLLTTAPVDAVRARVSIGIAGTSSTDASGTVSAGSSLQVDDVVLSRPQATITAASSRSSAYHGTTVTLSGNVYPRSAAGQPVTIYVRQPGSAWRALGTVNASLTDSGLRWKRSFTFTRRMPTGPYYFRASVPRFSYYLGSSSSPVKVRLR